VHAASELLRSTRGASGDRPKPGPAANAGARGKPGPAAEWVQAIWLRGLQGFGGLQDPTRFRSWLFGIAHRRLMDRLRERYSTPLASGESIDEIRAELPDPDRDLEVRELERGMQQLPASEREVLSLFYLEELSLVEVAQVLAVPVGTVKSRLFRARKLLRLEITGESHD